MWSEFNDAFAFAFESILNNQEVRWSLRNLKQTGCATREMQRFKELQFRLPSITEEEAYLASVSRLTPHLAGQVGAHTHGDLSAAQAMAGRLHRYTTNTK